MSDSMSSMASELSDFNDFPNRYLHRTWWQSLKYGHELELLASFKRTEPRVAKVILKLFKLTNCYKYEFDHSIEQVLLLSETDLCSLANHLGLCFTCQSISQSILKSEKLEYKQELGEDAYLFALNEAKLLRDSMGITDSYPIKKGGSLAQNRSIGLHVLGKALAQTDTALIQRLILKLGKPYEHFIKGTSSLRPLSASQPDCEALVKAVALHLGFYVESEQGIDISETQ